MSINVITGKNEIFFLISEMNVYLLFPVFSTGGKNFSCFESE